MPRIFHFLEFPLTSNSNIFYLLSLKVTWTLTLNFWSYIKLEKMSSFRYSLLWIRNIIEKELPLLMFIFHLQRTLFSIPPSLENCPVIYLCIWNIWPRTLYDRKLWFIHKLRKVSRITTSSNSMTVVLWFHFRASSSSLMLVLVFYLLQEKFE